MGSVMDQPRPWEPEYHKEPKSPLKLTNIILMEDRCVRVGREVFGDENMDNPAERLMRFGEEAIELLQAGDISEEQAYQLVAYVYGRKKEKKIGKEFAGSFLTLMAAARAHKVDLVDAYDAEVKRLLARKDQARAKHDNKPRAIKG